MKYCLRGFFKQPGFVAMAVVALGLGIGSVTAIFSVAENVLFELRRLAIPENTIPEKP